MPSLPDLRSADDLLAFLRDDLDWPLPDHALADELTFDWSDGDLRLGEKAAQKLPGGVIRQLRPMHPAQPWGIFLVEFADEQIYRTALREILRGLVPSRRKHASLAAWQHENLLFLCTTRDYERITFAHFRGEKAGRARLATFGWEKGARYARTLLEFNLPALAWPDTPGNCDDWLRAWSAAFDIEPVTREFFRVYREVFEKVEAAVTGLADPDRRRLFTQRLFNRLMFIAFIEKKGWLKLADRIDYLAALWEAWESGASREGRQGREGGASSNLSRPSRPLREAPSAPEPGQSFYNARLRLLFFQALNNAHEQNLMVINRGGLLARFLGDVPYLNGGLFEQDADDLDARITVPDSALAAIFTGLFDHFNFTVTESTPLDVEVAVDPEMLGKVFEELVTGRHESGSYYTPKPIVAFMCREALKHHLAGVLAEDKGALARFVDEHDPAALRDGEAMLGALRRVRVCDPACGSGAYLLGMLHELLELRACLFASRKIDAVSGHARKLEIIQHNLYGVDLDPFAVNIARLRLWLSLAVEYEGEKPPPLPNLDFKIEAGDSLAAPDPQTVFSGQGALRVTVAKQFQEAKAAYLLAHGEEKKTLRAQADALRGDLKTWLASEAPAGAFDWAVEFAEVFAPRPAPEHRFATRVADGNPSRRSPEQPVENPLAPQAGSLCSTATEPGGFDIIVANPPYVRQELIKAQKPVLKTRFECYTGVADLFVYFYERAVKILRPGGTLAFISSNKYYRAGYGEKLRAFLARETRVRTLVDFGDHPVFGAIAYASILIASRGKPAPDAAAQALTWSGGSFENVGEIVSERGQAIRQDELTTDGWRLESPEVLRLLAKLRANGTPLGEYVKGRFYYGIKTGLNEAFVVDRGTRDRLIAEDKSSAEILKPFLRGRDVKRWEVEPQDLWLIFTRRGIDIKNYPAILKHLTKLKKELTPGGNGGRKPGSYEWYEIQDNIAYWQEFSHPKIIYPDIYEHQSFAWDETGAFATNTCYFIPTTEKWMTALLNSHGVEWFYSAVSNKVRGGYLRAFSDYICQIPIPAASTGDQATLTALVDRILTAKRADDGATVKRLEAEIDTHVFRLYGLTPAEIALIASAK